MDAHADETGSQREVRERQLLRITMGEARDWMCKQTDNIMYELCQLDFDWTSSSAMEKEGLWAEDD